MKLGENISLCHLVVVSQFQENDFGAISMLHPTPKLDDNDIECAVQNEAGRKTEINIYKVIIENFKLDGLFI